MQAIAETPDTRTSFRVQQLTVSGGLSDYVRALMAVEIESPGPIPLAIAPHDTLMLSLQFGRSADPIEEKGEHGRNIRLTGIRRWTGSFSGAGNCISLFALLTPLGLVRVLESQTLEQVPRIRAQVADLLDRRITRDLESEVAMAAGLDDKLMRFAAWLEGRVASNRLHTPAALRAGRAAMRICSEPTVKVETLAAENCVSRRQLERDFGRWIGTSPRHLSQVARVQSVSRKGRSGASLADIATDVGFADQAHMCRVLRQLTGMTPQNFVRSRSTPMAAAFRIATGGGTVYL